MLLLVDAVETFQRALQNLKKGELSRISEATGIDLSRLSGYKNGRKTDVQISTFAMIAKAMNRSADELLGLQPPNPAAIEAERAKRETEADAEFQADLIRGLEQIRARIAKGKGARR